MSINIYLVRLQYSFCSFDNMTDAKNQPICLAGWRRWLCCVLVVCFFAETGAHTANLAFSPSVAKLSAYDRLAPEQQSRLVKKEIDLFLQLRGGADSEEISMESSSSSVVVTKLRNVIRSVLEIGDRKVPALAKPLRSLLKSLEGVLGVELLPKAPKKKKKNKKSKKANTTKEDDEEGEATVEETKTKTPNQGIQNV